MPTPRNPTVHVPVIDDLESVFHTTTSCPEIPLATEPVTRSAARRNGLVECSRCFETRMRQLEHHPGEMMSVERRSAAASVSGFSHFAVE